MWVLIALGIALLVAALGLLALSLHVFTTMRWLIRETRYDAYFKRPVAARRAFKTEVAHRGRRARRILLRVPRALMPVMPTKVHQGVHLPTLICPRADVERALVYRPDAGDVFIATQMKCGTTWGQQIIYEVLMHGRGDLSDAGHGHMYAVSPWIESAGAVRMDDAPRIGAERRRIVKTHLPASLCPYAASARYVYVIRHPLACFSSTVDFTQMLGGPLAFDREQALDWYCSDTMWWGSWASHVEGWWRWAQTRPNVLFLHFEHMLDDVGAAVDQVAALLDVALAPDERAAVVEKSGYRYMKAHEEVFEMAAPTLFSAGGTFFVSGKSGADRGGGVAEQERIQTFCRRALSDASFPLATFYPDVASPVPEA